MSSVQLVQVVVLWCGGVEGVGVCGCGGEACVCEDIRWLGGGECIHECKCVAEREMCLNPIEINSQQHSCLAIAVPRDFLVDSEKDAL